MTYIMKVAAILKFYTFLAVTLLVTLIATLSKFLNEILWINFFATQKRPPPGHGSVLVTATVVAPMACNAFIQ